MIGYVTYYWQAPERASLENAIYNIASDDDGNSVFVSKFDNLGIAEGNGTYGGIGTFYTCARIAKIIETPIGCGLADPYIVSNLLGVWA